MLHFADRVINVTSQIHPSRCPICYTLRACVCTHTLKLPGSLMSLQELPSSQGRAAENGIMYLFVISGFSPSDISLFCLLEDYPLRHLPDILSHCSVLNPSYIHVSCRDLRSCVRQRLGEGEHVNDASLQCAAT